jgi:hypothetical protein
VDYTGYEVETVEVEGAAPATVLKFELMLKQLPAQVPEIQEEETTEAEIQGAGTGATETTSK